MGEGEGEEGGGREKEVLKNLYRSQWFPSYCRSPHTQHQSCPPPSQMEVNLANKAENKS